MNPDQILQLSALFTQLAKRANPSKPLYFTPEEFQTINECGLVTSFEDGGLLLGPSHSDRGITVLQEMDGLFQNIAEFEGWEFVCNAVSTRRFFNRIDAINKAIPFKKDLIFEPYPIDRRIKKLDVQSVTFGEASLRKFLFLPQGAFFIVNKFATKKYLYELHAINEKGII